jgi:hypothetical protein
MGHYGIYCSRSLAHCDLSVAHASDRYGHRVHKRDGEEKEHIMKRRIKHGIFYFGMCAMLMMLVISPLSLYGQQGDKTAQKKERKQKKARIQLDYYNINGQEYSIKATVKTKEGRSYVTVPGVPVNFNVTSEDGMFEANLGEIVSDAKGVAQITGKIGELPVTGIVIFKAGIKASKDFKKYAKKLEVTNAVMDVSYVTEDSTSHVKVRCFMPDSTGNRVAVGGLDVKVYVERLFGELPVAVDFNTTDDNGEVDIEFPPTVHGDLEGKLMVVVRVEDHDEYGNLVNRQEMEWGIPQVIESNGNGRLLWAGKYKAPIPLVIIVNGVLITVWGSIFFILLNVLKIYRLGRKTESTLQT